MVLDEAVSDQAPTDPSSTEEWSFDENGDDDGSSRRNLSVDLTSLPKPLPVIGSVFGYPRSGLRSVVAQHIAFAETVLQRRVTRSEADALSSHISRMYTTSSYGRPVGFALGCYQAYRTANTFRFPFFTPPPEIFNPNVWPHPSKPLATQATSRFLWHVPRYGLYTMFGMWLCSPVFKSLASVWCAINESRDDRLQRFNSALAKRSSLNVQARRDRIEQGRRQQQQQQPQQQPQPQEAQTQAFPWPDDASPTSASSDYGFVGLEGDDADRQPRAGSAGAAPGRSRWDEIRAGAVGANGKANGAGAGPRSTSTSTSTPDSGSVW